MKNSFDFDTIIDRRNTNCGKWDTMDQKYKVKDLIHLGVADMDFRSPEPIIHSFSNCLEHGIFGYTDLNEEYYSSFIKWMKRWHQVEVNRDEIVFCPRINIVAGLCVEAFTNKGDQVLIQTPAYGPLYQSVVKNSREVLENPLIKREDTYEIDFEHLEKSVTNKTKMLILCSPHNPVGRVWTKEELDKIGEFCIKHNLILFVDEIHGDIVKKGVHFLSALKGNEKIRERLIVATSPTKTFNIPGVIVSYLVIPNEQLREKVKFEIDRVGIHNPTIFAVKAVESAYTLCDSWYEKMLEYIDENERFTREYFQTFMPEFHIYKREGTYLLWINYEKLGVHEEQLEQWFLHQANVTVYMGTVFQEVGRGFFRLNLASPKALLKEAFERMKKVYPYITSL